MLPTPDIEQIDQKDFDIRPSDFKTDQNIRHGNPWKIAPQPEQSSCVNSPWTGPGKGLGTTLGVPPPTPRLDSTRGTCLQSPHLQVQSAFRQNMFNKQLSQSSWKWSGKASRQADHA